MVNRDSRQRFASKCIAPLQRGRLTSTNRQTGDAALPVVVGVGAFAFVLGVFGPALDGEPYGTKSGERDFRGEVAVFTTHAAQICEQAAGDGATLKHLAAGEIACGDADSRKPVHVIYAFKRVPR